MEVRDYEVTCFTKYEQFGFKANTKDELIIELSKTIDDMERNVKLILIRIFDYLE